MGDRRKLQGEIDRCLKKVAEGVETFEDIWQKVHSAPNHNQKDKYEQELKKEIKKLQRLRDQIKAWISSTEIKDKQLLQEARKNIEQQMERFKVVERETKTKAYSKEGLGAGQKLDPQEKEKEECNQWIADAIHELNIQIDKFEVDMESISASLKKKKSDKEKLERLEETKNSIERHKYHIESLEKILRAINNDALDPKSIHNLRADIEYYVESNQDSDFKENDLMYEEIDLDNLGTLMTPVPIVSTQSHPPLLTNGTSSSSSSVSTTSALMDIHSLSNHISERTLTTSSNHADSESALASTTPSSTQASSPIASPALSLSDERKRNKSESEENQSHRNRSNSGANQGSSSHTTHVTSPKNSSGIVNQSPSVLSNSKSNHNSAPSSASLQPSTSHASHFPYPTSSNSSITTTTTTTTTTVPGLQYSTIVLQNTNAAPASTNNTTHGNLSKASPQILSPSNKQTMKFITNGNGSSTITNTNNDSTLVPSLASVSQLNSNSTSSTNHPPSLLATSTANDRTGTNNIHFNLDSSSLPSASINETGSSQSSILTRSGASDIDRSSAPFTNLSSTSKLADSSNHRSFADNAFAPVSSSASVLPNLSTDVAAHMSSGSTTNGANGVIGSISSGIQVNADQHPMRVLLQSNAINQSNVATGRVPLTQSEIRILNRLNSAYSKLPSLLESERQRTNANRICGRNPLGHGQAIPYYPQTPPSGSDSAEFYYRLAPDTLFFVFYYMEGTRAQYLAAKALKRQSWRFHTKHMMWFQRHEEPKTITDDYEQGTYIFFDYERWQTRKRDNFMFEYKFLEDREF